MRADWSNSGPCLDGGTLAIQQAPGDSLFTISAVQSGHCPPERIGNRGIPAYEFPAASTSSGWMTGDSVGFTVFPCVYHGLLTRTPSDTLAGTVGCRIGARLISGTWSAGKVSTEVGASPILNDR
jgi:hypothetical protein